MRKLDLIVGIVGGVVLLAALAGAYFEGSTGALVARNFPIEWKTEPVDLHAHQEPGFATGFETPFTVAATNLTAAQVTVVLTAGQGYLTGPAGDQVTVTVTLPNGTAVAATGSLVTGSSSTVALTIPVNTLPPVGSANGATGDEALRNLNETATNATGTGEWNVEVRLARTAGAVGSASAEVTVTGNRYVATLKPEGPGVSPK